MTEEEIIDAMELYKSGLNFSEVAAKTGRHVNTILNLMNSRYKDLLRSGAVGPGGPHWRGGRTQSHGYSYIWVSDDDPFKCMAVKSGKGGESRYVLEHRLVLARRLGRALLPTETVHHIDGDIKNNSSANLELRQGKHGKHVVMCCLECGSRNIGHTTIGN